MIAVFVLPQLNRSFKSNENAEEEMFNYVEKNYTESLWQLQEMKEFKIKKWICATEIL